MHTEAISPKLLHDLLPSMCIITFAKSKQATATKRTDLNTLTWKASQLPLLLLPVHIALLHLVIDPACTVVFEGIPATPQLMQQPPRPADARLFTVQTWHQALVQGGLLCALVLGAAFWPDLAVPERRGWVFALLLLGGGVLVWWNGDRRSTLTRAGSLIGVGLWLLVQAIPGLAPLLGLAPTPPALALGLTALMVALVSDAACLLR